LVDLPELVRKVESRIEQQAEGRRLIFEAPATMEPVLAEQAKLEQVMLNIIGNALKYSPEGGDIEISVRRLKEKAMVSVTDHGIGIPRSSCLSSSRSTTGEESPRAEG